MMESTLTIKFRGAEADVLDRLIRSALMKYGADLGFLRAKDPWATLEKVRRRRVTESRLRNDVQRAEDGD